MADVLLTVGVNPNIDFSQFEKDLDAVFSKYEKSSKKRTIDVEFTLSSAAQSSLDNLDAKLKSIQDKAIATSAKLKGINTALEGSSPKDSKKISQNTKLYQDSVKAIKEYYDALRKLNTYKTDITEVNGVYQSEGKWNNLAKELNETSAAYQRISNVIKALPESMGTRLADEMLAAQRKFNLWLEEQKNTKTTDMTSEVEKQQALIDKAIMLQNRLRSNINGYSAAGNNQSTKGIFEGLKVRISDIDTLIDSLKSGKISAEEFANAIDQCAKKTAQDVAALKADGVARKSWADNFKGALSKFSAWLSASQMIMLAVRSMKQMVNEAISVDSAMTQMQIVTRASSTEMKAFGETAAAVAKQTASSMTDIIDSATTYARLGYSSETSTMLAKYTSMISKVGDIDVSEVQSAVTAIVKAFKIDANDTAAVEAVFDKLITTGNNLPISVKELAEGLNNASSALAAAGNSYEESLAMLAASNATVQDVSKSSTGLRTIVARIRNTKTELDDLGESMTNVEYDNIVKALTQYNVSLTDSQGNLRSSYEIFKDIAKVANELKETSPNDYAALAETLAGTRMQNVFFSLVENFDEAEKAMNLMDKSAGSLDEAFSTYSDSIAAHVQQFKTQFQELSVALVDSGLAKGIVDIGTGILNLATAITKAGMALPTLLAGIAAFKSLQSIS